MKRWYVLPLNPEPWRIGPISSGRGRNGGHYQPKVGRDQQLASYQEAVKSAIGGHEELYTGDVTLTFYFWRALAVYRGTAKDVQKHQVDATNMQKGTEDALQGILFANDNQVREVRTVIMDQGPGVEPMVVLCIDDWDGPDVNEIPPHVWTQMTDADTPVPVENRWPPSEDF